MKKFKVKTDCGALVEYDTAHELGFIVGYEDMKMHNPYEPIHSEYEEYNEGRADGKKSRIDSMTKRESGWYRVWYSEGDESWLALYDSGYNFWSAPYSDCGHSSDEFHKIDPQMVMTPYGEMVYNQPTERTKAAVERYNNPDSWNVKEHDPLYNTKQEG